MKQWIATLPLIVLLSSDLAAWGRPRYPLETPPQTGPGAKEFPLRQDQAWFVNESLLIWHPYEDDLDFGAHYSTSDGESFKLSPQAPKFKWGTGVKLAIGRYLPHHELWDVSLTTTYFYGAAEHKSKATPTDDSFIVSTWAPSIFGTALSKSTAKWQLNYFTWDFGCGRSFFMTPSILIHPHLDLRAALMYLHYDNRNTDTRGVTKYNSSNNLWAMGPRFGTDFSYNFKRMWSFLGNFSASVLYASYGLNSKMHGISSSSPSYVHASKSYNMVAPNLEAAIGLGWEEWVRNKTVRIAASFLFEGVQWFNVNRLFQINLNGLPFNNGTVLQFFPPTHHAGDLRFFGFSLNIQTDF